MHPEGEVKMVRLRYAEAIDYLLESLPQIQQYYSKRSAQLYADKNPHVVYGSILVEFLNEFAREVTGPTREIADSILKAAFRTIEALSASNDFELRYLVKTSVLEGLLGEKGGLESFAPFMHHETKKLARELAETWGLDTRILS